MVGYEKSNEYLWKWEKFSKLTHGQNVWETGHGFPTMTLLCIAKMMQNSHTFKWVI